MSHRADSGPRVEVRAIETDRAQRLISPTRTPEATSIGLNAAVTDGLRSETADATTIEPADSRTVLPNACTITVNSTAQEVTIAQPEGVRNSNCTLGEAILVANGNPNITECPCAGGAPATIQLQAGATYTLTAAATTLYGPTGLPAVSSTIVIEGNGATITRGSANNFRLFSVAGTINGVQARETNPNSTNPVPNALLPAGNLTLRNLTLSNGRAKAGDGLDLGGGGGGMGGAVFNAGTLIVDRCTLTGNATQGGSGGLSPVGFDLSGGGGGMGGDGGGNGGAGGGMGGSGAGGGFGAGGGGTVGNGSGSTGGILNGGSSGGGGGFGGGGSSGNPGGSGGFGGGGGSGGTIGGPGGFGGGGGAIVGGGAGTTAGNGGFGGGGGGDFSFAGGGLGGFGAGSGGGINGGGGGAGLGGAIFSNGTLSMTNSTVSGNSAIGGTGVNNGQGLGGGIFIRNGTTTITNCTLNANTANGGGGLYVLGDGTDNTATVTVVNTIIANTPSGTDAFVNTNSGGTVTQTGNATNLVESNGGGINGLQGVTQTADPNLAALALNGGTTQTHLPQTGSPAINNGSGGRPNNIDQRGFPTDGIPDIGSVEIPCPTITVTNPATATGTAGTAFSQTFTASGGTGPYTFNVQTGTLPTGLSLSGGGVLSGTPTQTGSFPIVVRATDSNGCFGDGAIYNLVINCQTITVNPAATLAVGTVGTAYSQTFTQTGGIGTTSFSNTGTLPTGLTLTSGGVLSGTPTAAGNFAFTIVATDSNGCTGSRAYTIQICPVITVNPTTLPAGTVGTGYNQTITATGGTGPYTFAVTAGTLPAGLTLTTAGVLSGTPTVNGAFNFTITASDSSAPTACPGSRAYTLAINCPGIGLTPATLPGGTVGTGYSQGLTGTGGTAPYGFTLQGGSLPPGLTLVSGTIAGTPTTTGTFNFTIRVTDGTTPTPCTADIPLSITIGCQTITVTNPATTTGTVGTAFSQTFTQTGGIGATNFTTTSTLPAGLTLATIGTLSGTPTQTGTFPIVVRATDSNNCQGTGVTYTLVINCPTIALSSLPGGTAGTAYNQTITATPAGGAYSFAVTAGTLPAGLTLSSAGVLSGTPTAAGTFNFTVTATGFGTCTGAQAYSLVIACPTITLTPTTLPGGTAGTSYNQTLTASPAGTTYSFAVTAGALPAGLTLTTAGALTGTPTAQGSFNFTVTATGFGTCTGVQAYSLVIACPTITVNPASLPGGAAGTAYVQSITATGTLGAANFTVSAGSLPPGLTLTAGGTLSGTPTALGSFTFTIRATDTNTCFGERAYTIIVACPSIAVNPASLPGGTAAVAYSQTITATGTLGAPAFTVSTGTLPAGLTLNPTTGVLSGTPTVIGTFNFTIRATDTNAGTNTCFGERAYSLVLTCPTITVNPVTLPAANVSVAYSQTVTASGGIAPYSFAVTTGTLPAGLTLDGTTGAITGTATTVGNFTFTITATDANKCTGTRNYTVAVGGVELALLYVADTDNSRIQVFDGTNWSLAPRSSGVVGSAAGQFRSPEGVTATRTNQIYVADTGNNRIHWYNGFTWADFATIGSGLNQVRAPQAVAIDVTGQFLFVADTGNNRVLRFNANAPNSAGVVLANTGGGSGQVNNPRGLAVDNLGNLFVADTGNSRILRISSATSVMTADIGTIVGTNFREPEGLAFDNDGNLYIADTGNNRILQLSGGAPGTPTVLAVLGTSLGNVRSAEGVTVTNFAAGPFAGRQIVVGDTLNNRIQARPLAGGAWSLVGGTGSGLGQFRGPSKVR